MGETKKPEICNSVMRGTGMGASDLYAIIKGYCAQFKKAEKPEPAETAARAEQTNERARAMHDALKRLEAADPCRPGGEWAKANRSICRR